MQFRPKLEKGLPVLRGRQDYQKWHNPIWII